MTKEPPEEDFLQVDEAIEWLVSGEVGTAFQGWMWSLEGLVEGDDGPQIPDAVYAKVQVLKKQCADRLLAAWRNGAIRLWGRAASHAAHRVVEPFKRDRREIAFRRARDGAEMFIRSDSSERFPGWPWKLHRVDVKISRNDVLRVDSGEVGPREVPRRKVGRPSWRSLVRKVADEILSSAPHPVSAAELARQVQVLLARRAPFTEGEAPPAADTIARHLRPVPRNTQRDRRRRNPKKK